MIITTQKSENYNCCYALSEQYLKRSIFAKDNTRHKQTKKPTKHPLLKTMSGRGKGGVGLGKSVKKLKSMYPSDCELGSDVRTVTVEPPIEVYMVYGEDKYDLKVYKANVTAYKTKFQSDEIIRGYLSKMTSSYYLESYIYRRLVEAIHKLHALRGLSDSDDDESDSDGDSDSNNNKDDDEAFTVTGVSCTRVPFIVAS